MSLTNIVNINAANIVNTNAANIVNTNMDNMNIHQAVNIHTINTENDVINNIINMSADNISMENMYIVPALISIIILLILIIVITVIKKRRKYPYEAKFLLTKTEYAFFKELQEITDEKGYMICPKVRLEDFIYVTNRKELGKFRGYIKSRHVDFLICDSNLHIICGIELDDKSHESDEAKKIDNFKDELFRTIGIPLHRIKVEEDYEGRIRGIL